MSDTRLGPGNPLTTTDLLHVAVAAVQIQAKWAIAASTLVNQTVPDSGYAHMMVDDNSPILLALSPLGGVVTQDQVDARVNLFRSLQIDHYQGVGSIFVDGEHVEVDTVNLANLEATPNATDLASCITLINATKTAIIDHGWGDSNAGHHFHDDQTIGGRFFVLPVDPPVTLADCIADANAILASLIEHFTNAVPLPLPTPI